MIPRSALKKFCVHYSCRNNIYAQRELTQWIDLSLRTVPSMHMLRSTLANDIIGQIAIFNSKDKDGEHISYSDKDGDIEHIVDRIIETYKIKIKE